MKVFRFYCIPSGKRLENPGSCASAFTRRPMMGLKEGAERRYGTHTVPMPPVLSGGKSYVEEVENILRRTAVG